ncbi:homoserine dehydrogenase [Heyndrickxia sporothermodurans]|uniref:Homoserine dehydrogenase n=1 Tax=Heyndrickxia sporothermodurans TaxID=46224 RepID=A0AB37HDZ9_9BACI|nr:homoserine dehydrogenase [Heyndrickxia sporothermodurans]MBL5766210.1 homoserine dehydrogenase [Heyndrickxia sporothermodurans]MBL5769650.1 homoserine dehydrogenase [Heyndrickxia sporothermodurans]MBL5776847.1 homoserine dehydrogenase [Heyndrickxia sporothermodurans]MBL5780408.1 homoserine dehydrogenase [Heyndrickxia sporothermodurans]MBL5784019.1 homoserine dehydrogenase [Heyndrickxia sporothermodurans]
MKKISVGLLGFGTVGTGVVHLLTNDQQRLVQQSGSQIQISKILVKDREKSRKMDQYDHLLTLNPSDVIDNPEIDIIIEVMGGIDDTRKYIHRALKNKKHVITANKDLMALYGTELLQAAADEGCDLYYEASVGGGIPILRGLTDGLAADRIKKLIGIVNGTTNYILSKMSHQSVSYEKVLQEAQSLGFAEADPTSDVEGLDAARKMVILSHLAYSIPVTLEDVKVEGITRVAEEDIQYSKKLGYAIKLVGIAEVEDDEIDIRVGPTLLPFNHPLASVDNEFNAIYVYGHSVGETMFYGPGAGELPTAIAVVSDLITVVKNMAYGINGKHIFLPLQEKKCKSSETVESQYFLRLHVKDQPGALSKVTGLFNDQGMSLQKIIQEPLLSGNLAEVAIITHTTEQQRFEQIYQLLKDLEDVIDVKSYYRVEGMK